MTTKTRSPNSTFVPSVVASLLFLITAFAIVGKAEAQWRFEPVVRVGAEKDDNATLSVRTDDVLDVTGTLIDASARFDYDSALTDFFITPRIVSRDYDKGDIDSEDTFLNSELRRTTQSGSYGIQLSYDRQTVRTAERSDTDLDIDDPSDIPDDDTGLVRFSDYRNRLSITPTWEYRFSDVGSLDMNLRYIGVSYDDELQSFLEDYYDARYTIGLNREFSERTTGVVTATVRQFEGDQTQNRSTGYGMMAGFERQITETSALRALVGFETTENDLIDSQTEPVANISYRQRLETINMLAQYRRTMSGNGSGRVGVRDAFNLNFSRRLTEKVTAGIGGRFFSTNSIDNVITVSERDYVQLRAQFIWYIVPSIAAELDYRFTLQNRSALPESSNSNQVILWFSYQPNSIDRRFINRPSARAADEL